jgi:hypothetical protein
MGDAKLVGWWCRIREAYRCEKRGRELPLAEQNDDNNPKSRLRRAREYIPSASDEALKPVLAYLGAMRTSFSLSITFMPGCSRKNRISEAGSVEE